MVSNTYNRYLWLLNTLLQYKRLTFEEIKSKWENSYLSDGGTLTLRTFHLHRNAVEEMFDINIECDKNDGYKYYIERDSEQKRNKAMLWLLNSFNVSNVVEEGRQLNNRILLEEIPEGTEFLSTIIKAMNTNHELRIIYKKFSDSTPLTYNIKPYCMKVLRQRWYILSWSNESNGLRHFSLDRIEEMEITQNSFTYPKDFEPEEFYKYSIGVWVDDNLPPEKVVIRTFGKQSNYFRTLPLHHSQREINTSEDFCDFSYQLSITKDLINELLSKGSSIEVLQPESLREQIIQSAKNIISIYQK